MFIAINRLNLKGSTCHVDMQMINSDIPYILFSNQLLAFRDIFPYIKKSLNHAMDVYLSANDCNNYVTHIQIWINIDIEWCHQMTIFEYSNDDVFWFVLKDNQSWLQNEVDIIQTHWLWLRSFQGCLWMLYVKNVYIQ